MSGGDPRLALMSVLGAAGDRVRGWRGRGGDRGRDRDKGNGRGRDKGRGGGKGRCRDRGSGSGWNRVRD